MKKVTGLVIDTYGKERKGRGHKTRNEHAVTRQRKAAVKLCTKITVNSQPRLFTQSFRIERVEDDFIIAFAHIRPDSHLAISKVKFIVPFRLFPLMVQKKPRAKADGQGVFSACHPIAVSGLADHALHMAPVSPARCTVRLSPCNRAGKKQGSCDYKLQFLHTCPIP